MGRRALARVLAAVLGLGTVVACGGASGSSGLGSLPEGNWGGDHISLVATRAGASLEFDCAHGTIDQPLALDRDGRLSATGTFVPEQPGPIREGQGTPRPARYDGITDGRTLRLTVTLVDRTESAGTFTLTYRAAPRLTKCL